MKRLLSLSIGALLIASSTLLLKTVLDRRMRKATPPGSADEEFKGHPWFAATYDFLSRGSESGLIGRLRSSVVAEATGRVLEVGAGTGVNFPYYGRADQIVATEPDPFMLKRAMKRAEDSGVRVEFHQARAEALPFPDAAFDTVVATLVFCTVAHPDRALAEVRRVLKPGGTFRFIEHVRSEGRVVARVQDLLTPLWDRFGAGCHLNRPTVDAIRAAGFEIVETEKASFPLQPVFAGVAVPTPIAG